MYKKQNVTINNFYCIFTPMCELCFLESAVQQKHEEPAMRAKPCLIELFVGPHREDLGKSAPQSYNAFGLKATPELKTIIQYYSDVTSNPIQEDIL